ncbi:MAG: glycosyltransferase, partial [Cryobacterium sp.]|nr:glycosyltransferase [Cryobacterium sp.]
MPRSDSSALGTTPNVVVLLATYNGERFLEEQLATILDQQNVAVSVIALDDGSGDTTPQLLAEAAARDPRITVLPDQGASGSAAANFARLLLEVSFEDNALVAFSDQDDVWMPDKLARHVHLLQSGALDGVSSNVIAFDEHDRRTLIRKDFPQRKF